MSTVMLAAGAAGIMAAGQLAHADPASIAGSDTDLASRPLIKGDLKTFDISGFKIGMSAQEVQRIAAGQHLTTNNGTRLVAFDPSKDGRRGPSYQSRIARDAATRLNRPMPPIQTVVYEAFLANADGDKWDLTFLPTEDGPRLTSVMLFTSPRGNTAEMYRTLVEAKYGKAPDAGANTASTLVKFCARDDGTCTERPAFVASSNGHEATLFLTAGTLAGIALYKRIEAASTAGAAVVAGKPTF